MTRLTRVTTGIGVKRLRSTCRHAVYIKQCAGVGLRRFGRTSSRVWPPRPDRVPQVGPPRGPITTGLPARYPRLRCCGECERADRSSCTLLSPRCFPFPPLNSSLFSFQASSGFSTGPYVVTSWSPAHQSWPSPGLLSGY